jgi:hypothetical protein
VTDSAADNDVAVTVSESGRPAAMFRRIAS